MNHPSSKQTDLALRQAFLGRQKPLPSVCSALVADLVPVTATLCQALHDSIKVTNHCQLDFQGSTEQPNLSYDPTPPTSAHERLVQAQRLQGPGGLLTRLHTGADTLHALLPTALPLLRRVQFSLATGTPVQQYRIGYMLHRGLPHQHATTAAPTMLLDIFGHQWTWSFDLLASTHLARTLAGIHAILDDQLHGKDSCFRMIPWYSPTRSNILSVNVCGHNDDMRTSILRTIAALHQEHQQPPPPTRFGGPR